ncbi:MAG: RluA family pseudouridine synthase [Anaerolineales bacterium]|nr:RluA family pseudouridine synthase [Anaerolineales bacterium]
MQTIVPEGETSEVCCWYNCSMTALDILYSDDSLLVVDKPAGLSTLPEGWERDAPCLAGLIEAEFGRLWVVHRLDKVTSGVIVFARSAAAHRALNLQFDRREVHKVYHAIVEGLPGWDEKTARQPLRVNVGHSHRTAVDFERGKPSVTRFRVLQRFAAPAPDRGYALLEAIPETGRTHQIRAHLAALGFPILADTLYSAPPVGRDAIPPLQRAALHAYSLEFEFNGTPFSFTAPYPEDFTRTLARLHVRTLASCLVGAPTRNL